MFSILICVCTFCIAFCFCCLSRQNSLGKTVSAKPLVSIDPVLPRLRAETFAETRGKTGSMASKQSIFPKNVFQSFFSICAFCIEFCYCHSFCRDQALIVLTLLFLFSFFWGQMYVFNFCFFYLYILY